MRLQSLIGATLLALAASATFAWRPEQRVTAVPDAAQMAAFQDQAEQACRCARGRAEESGKKDCWAAFERAVDPWPHGQESTMCEFSLDGICFEGSGGEACVAKGWSAPVGGAGAICTEAELQTAEAVWNEAFDHYRQGVTKEPPEQALKRTLAAFARNDPVARRSSEGGCGG